MYVRGGVMLGVLPALEPPAGSTLLAQVVLASVAGEHFHEQQRLCNVVRKRGFSVRSFGTGTHVKLPGPAPDKPNVYDFKTTYDQMYTDLLRKDKELYPCGMPP
ncbi:hypothetical protein lerEdw1_019731 [Lerista edwardsae]|nr:hypothetical protein lerEdw1_019731 [Lerista edwardsae]